MRLALTVDAVRNGVADEILQELPRTIRQIVFEIGRDVLVDPDENVDHLPEHVQPLARTFRRFARTMVRDVTRELSRTSSYSATPQPSGGQQQAGGFPQQMVLGQANGPVAGAGNGVSGLG